MLFTCLFIKREIVVLVKILGEYSNKKITRLHSFTHDPLIIPVFTLTF